MYAVSHCQMEVSKVENGLYNLVSRTEVPRTPHLVEMIGIAPQPLPKESFMTVFHRSTEFQVC